MNVLLGLSVTSALAGMLALLWAGLLALQRARRFRGSGVSIVTRDIKGWLTVVWVCLAVAGVFGACAGVVRLWD